MWQFLFLVFLVHFGSSELYGHQLSEALGYVDTSIPSSSQSSHHAFSWNFTTTWLSYAWGIRGPFPWNISNNLTRGTSSAKIVNCTVHCCFSKPDAPPRYRTVEVTVTSYPSPPMNVNGNGVRSTTVKGVNCPSGRLVSPSAATCLISKWKWWILLFKSLGWCWLTFVVLCNEMCIGLWINRTSQQRT